MINVEILKKKFELGDTKIMSVGKLIKENIVKHELDGGANVDFDDDAADEDDDDEEADEDEDDEEEDDEDDEEEAETEQVEDDEENLFGSEIDDDDDDVDALVAGDGSESDSAESIV
jgi:hypothetical protein